MGPCPRTTKKRAGPWFDFPYEAVVEKECGDFSVPSIAKSGCNSVPRRSSARNQALCNHVFDFFEV